MALDQKDCINHHFNSDTCINWYQVIWRNDHAKK